MTKRCIKKGLVRMWDSMRNSCFKGKETCLGVKCEECPLYQFADCSLSINLLDIYNIVEKWSKEYPLKKYKISKLEYDILKYISDNKTCTYITRDENGFLCLFNEKPEKNAGYWKGFGLIVIDVFDELFQFVKWKDEEPTSIKDVLDNCEVKEDV